MKSSSFFRPAFTIVELLVVVAILIVLAALIFTASKRGLESAHAVTCSNNLRVIAIGHVALAEENNGVLVHAWKAKPFGSWNRNWSEFHAINANPDLGWRARRDDVLGQMRNMEHLRCPIAAKRHRKEMEKQKTHNGLRTYAMNQRIGAISEPGDSQYNWIDGVETVLQVESASALVLLTEKAWDGSKYPGSCGPNAASSTYADFHGGHGHVAYFDGHVEKVRPDELPLIGSKLPNGETVNLNNIESSNIWRGRPFKRTR